MSWLGEIFALQAGVGEMMLRGTTIYWVLFLLLRISGRRDLGSLGTADLLVLVLVADAAGNAMSGDSDSLGDGIIVVSTIVGWSFVLDRLTYRLPLLRRLLEPSRVCLVRDGRIDIGGLRREHVSRAELMEQLRLKGIPALSMVYRAYIESNGEFSVIRTEDAKSGNDSTLEEG
ncbi:hypothetical protein CEK29_12340 [Bordetella genomosp. 5]|uniref:DUF421 domain-containing protein n=1 Tax=Bordetella genomosp. 5 TaxID=1395608 RepID=UPI000B9ED2A8|nr:YetF domain-containing protein [Bordetella genomosp. 5]OZI42532.1 hypothetical protein CEK29_12340 [Bordetella genomosp. 5]